MDNNTSSMVNELGGLVQMVSIVNGFIDECGTKEYGLKFSGFGVDKQKLQGARRESAIITAVHCPFPLNRQLIVADKGVILPHGDNVTDEVMIPPMHPYMDDQVGQNITKVMEKDLSA